jgi:hypothetical protein
LLGNDDRAVAGDREFLERHKRVTLLRGPAVRKFAGNSIFCGTDIPADFRVKVVQTAVNNGYSSVRESHAGTRIAN